MFVYMLTEATHKPTRFGTVDLQRGQLVTGRHKLAEHLGLSEQKVRTCLEHLHKLNMITSNSTNKYTIYTIVNYSKYQDTPEAINQQDNQQVTNNQPTSNQQVTTIQEHKHISTKEDKYIPPINGSEYSKAFLMFWDMYPNKKNKGSAYKAFKRIKQDEYTAIKEGLELAKKSQQWLTDNGKYIPHPSSWLNARGWEDEQQSSGKFDMDSFLKHHAGVL